MYLMCVSEVQDTGGQRCENYEVVALGSGQSCCSGWLSYTGSVVHDCHAIVIARRALKRCNHFEQYRNTSIYDKHLLCKQCTHKNISIVFKNSVITCSPSTCSKTVSFNTEKKIFQRMLESGNH